MGHHYTMDIEKYFLSKINRVKILVIAGSMKEFESFIEQALFKNSQEDIYDGFEFVYYSNTDSIRGMKFDKYLYYGTGAFRSDLDLFQIKSSIKF